MSEAAVRAEKLTKIYRLYSRPHYRFLDMFGALRNKAGAYTEHAALRDIDLEIRRGEKVAIIGRNGAGKSTLLKLITSVIEPTSGILEVKQGVNALLQLGTGFHPDFTGRENINSYLAHLGVGPSEARQRIPEIIDFSELEEYIDQPIKTYSTGMVARLMFSVSTAVTPDILVLDEILGVGDAYFAQKSYDRMKELCSGSGTTLLLVSHDIYGASRLCERMIWIDSGRIVLDAPSSSTIKAYEDSIRQQEEHRLRVKKQNRLKELQQSMPDVEYVMIEIRSRANLPLAGIVYFSEIALESVDGRKWLLPLASGGKTDGSHLIMDTGCWGELMEWLGRPARPMKDHGSSYHKVGAVFALDRELAPRIQDIQLSLTYCSVRPCDLLVVGYLGDHEIRLGDLPPSKGEWIRHVTGFDSRQVGPAAQSEVSTRGIQGSGTVWVSDVRCLDEGGNETHHLRHGHPMTLSIDFEVRKPDLCERAQCLVAFHRDGVQDVCRLITRDLFLDGRRSPLGGLSMHIPKLLLADGKYMISVLIVREGYYDHEQTVFYSINPGVYSCVSRVVEVDVSGGGVVGNGTTFVADAEWSMSRRITAAP
jgi:ABC-type polysaccharide/polyol phosphate transport system ATPase subunit